jgi:hypothetical protein
MPKQKNPENAPQLPLQYPGKNEQRKTPQSRFPRENEDMKKEIRRIESISNAVYGKPKIRKKQETKSPTTNLSGEFLIRNSARIKKWKQDYLETRQIPPQFDVNDKKREEFLKLIGWK